MIFFFIISFKVNGASINQAKNHLKKFNENGGISYKLAAFPTIKLPDQNNIAKNKYKYAILFLLNTKFLSKPL